MDKSRQVADHISELILAAETPTDCRKRIKAFLAEQKTGDICLHVNRGKIESLDLREHYRVVAAP